MILNSKERALFVAWLEATASDCKCIAAQMELLNGPATMEIIKREKMKAAACLIIANDLKEAELQDIS